MARLLPLCALGVPFVVGWAPRQGEAELQGVRGTIYLRNYSSLNYTVGGEAVVMGAGSPVIVEDTGSGVTLIAKSMRCVLKPIGAGKYEIQEATLADGAQVVFDSAVAQKSAVEAAKKANKPAPPAATEASEMTLESDTMAYSLAAGESTVRFPGPVTFSSTTDGVEQRKQGAQAVSVPFTQLTRASGSQGRFTFAVPQGDFDALQPRTGSLEGPVKFSLIRTATLPPAAGVAAAPEVTNVQGSGNRMDADFVREGDPTVVLDGDVIVEGSGKGFNGKITGTRATVTLDRATRQPKGYEFIGSPAKTVIRQGGGR